MPPLNVAQLGSESDAVPVNTVLLGEFSLV